MYQLTEIKNKELESLEWKLNGIINAINYDINLTLTVDITGILTNSGKQAIENFKTFINGGM